MNVDTAFKGEPALGEKASALELGWESEAWYLETLLLVEYRQANSDAFQGSLRRIFPDVSDDCLLTTATSVELRTQELQIMQAVITAFGVNMPENIEAISLSGLIFYIAEERLQLPDRKEHKSRI